jgi:hypothetical protein
MSANDHALIMREKRDCRRTARYTKKGNSNNLACNIKILYE